MIKQITTGIAVSLGTSVAAGGYGEPNEMFKRTAEDKRESLYNFMMWLANDRKG